jgi:hypothetical protein
VRRLVLALVAAVGIAAAACTSGGDVTADVPSTPDRSEPAVTAAPTPTETTPAPSTIVMWARGGLPADVATRAADLPGVLSAEHVRSDTLPLVGSRDADGAPVEDLAPGWMIPVDVMAIDPDVTAGTLPPGPTRDAVAALRPGEVLLPQSSAEQRDLDVGGQIDLSERPGLVVAGVVEDDVLGRDEVIVHVADADAVGLDEDGSLRILHDGSGGRALADDLEALAPADTAVRVVGTTSDEPARRTPLVLGLPEVKARFGEFSFRDDDADREIRVEPAWIEEHIVLADVPILGTVRCHRAIVEDLRAALQDVVDAGLASDIDPDDYGGCYHARRIGSHTTSLSRHSWGIAIDINVDFSEPGGGPPPSPPVVEAFADHGFRWGGHFLSPDNHHFEWVGDTAGELPPQASTGTGPAADGDTGA